jgi:small conductance mechanosensitive channel
MNRSVNASIKSDNLYQEAVVTEFLQSLLDRLSEIFNPTTLGNQLADLVANLLVGIIVYLAFYVAWQLIKRLLATILENSETDATTASFLQTVLKYGILLIGVVAALDAGGIDTSAALASLGIAGLTIGFAARDALSNLISGILIFVDRPFVVGDLVEIEDHYGKVSEITLRSTRIITSDGKMLAVPNTEVINKTVASYTNFPHLRLDIPVTIGVDEDIERARHLLLELVMDNPDYLDDPPARVVTKALNDYNVQIELQAWIRDERQHVDMRSELREQAFNALNQAGVDMPFETFRHLPLEVTMSQT